MTDTTRRSLALRRPDSSAALRPMVPGFINFTGTTEQYLRHTRAPLSSAVTTLGFVMRIRPAAIGILQRLCGWNPIGAGMLIDASNRLLIRVINTAVAQIGSAPSSVAIPSLSVTGDIWLSGHVATATASCSYWYSVEPLDDYSKVTWTPIGVPQTGSNAGTTAALTDSANLNVGTDANTSPAFNGMVYEFREFVNGVQTAWFTNTDIPAPTVTSFTSAGGGQLWALSPTTVPTVFHPTESYSGALRSDFVFNETTTGLTADEAMGVVGVDHTTTRISYKPPLIPEHPTLGVFEEAMVVRSTAGFPATNLDGAMLMRHSAGDPVLSGGWASVLDTDLIGQQWYYYALFVRYDSTSGWFKTDEQAWLNPGQYDYPERTWRNMPNYYRRIDQGVWLDPGYLRRICDTVGYEFDLLRTWAATVGDVWDFEKLSAKLLPEAGAALGLPAESANGDRRLRTLVGNLMALRKKKGTKDGVEGYVSAQTGWPSRAYEGLNLLHTTQHAEWLYTFTAGDISGPVTANGNPGWSSKTGSVVYGQVTRVAATGGEGAAIGLADGAFYLRQTNTTGVLSAMDLGYGSDTQGIGSMIPVRGSFSYRFSAAIKTSVASTVVRLMMDWYGAHGVFISTTTNVFATAGTAWSRVLSPLLVAPATARYGRPRLQVAAGMAANAHLNIYKPMFVDLTWRPEGIPTLADNVPLSSTNPSDVGTFIHRDYYERPREIKVNVYPMRTNLALNSDFTLNNLPPEAWASFDAPTYAQLPVAYSSYADIIDAEPGDSEANYLDMATGLAPLMTSIPVRSFNPALGRMILSKPSAPYGFSVMHTYFPATDLGGMSAALGVFSNVAGPLMSISFEWYTDNTSAARINVNGLPLRTTSPQYVLTTTESRYEVTNALPPDNALYGRLVVSFSHTAAFNVYFNWALIEDAPFPEAYFNGDFPDGDDGDFFYAVGRGYTGAPHLSPSVYYQQFRHFASGTAGSDTLSQLMPYLVPFRRPYKVITAATGLYNEVT